MRFTIAVAVAVDIFDRIPGSAWTLLFPLACDLPSNTWSTVYACDPASYDLSSCQVMVIADNRDTICTSSILHIQEHFI